MHLEQFWLDQVPNGPLSAIIYIHMPNILQTVLDAIVHYYKTGGMGVTSSWSPLGNFLEGQAHPNVFAFHRTRFFYFLWREVFFVCFPVVQGFSLRLLCIFSNSCQFKFFIYPLYIHIYIFYIFFHCTVGSLICWVISFGSCLRIDRPAHTLYIYGIVWSIY